MNNSNFKDALFIVAHRQEYNIIRQKRKKVIIRRLFTVSLVLLFVVFSVVVINIVSKRQVNNKNGKEILVNPSSNSSFTFEPEASNNIKNGNTPEIECTPIIGPTDSVPANATPLMTTEAPPEWKDPVCFFYSFDDFNKGIKSGELESLKRCSFYYVPENVRDNLNLDYIQTSESSVSLYYYIDSPGGRVNYVFEWYLQIKADQFKNAVLDHFAINFLEQSGYYILYNESAKLIEVFWYQDEEVFHALIPWNVQFDEMSHLCKMKKIVIK